MTRYNVIIERPAWEDIERYYQRAIAAGAGQHAARWFNRIVVFILDLESLPQWGSVVPEQDAFAERLYQKIFGRGYRIIYTITENHVHVLCVRGAGMRELSPEDVKLPK